MTDLPTGMYRRDDGIIYLNFRLLGRKFHCSTKTSDVESALKFKADMVDNVLIEKSHRADTKVKISSEMTLGEALDITFDDIHSKQKQAKNLKSTKEICKQIIGEVKLTNVRIRTLHALKNHLLENGRTMNTVNHYYSLVNKTLTYMHNVHEIDCMVFNRYKEDAPQADIVEITPEHEALIFQWLEDTRNFKNSKLNSIDAIEACKVSLGTGMRRGELLCFTPGMIRGRVIQFSSGQHKSGLHAGGKKVVLKQEIYDLIQARIARRQTKIDEEVFPYDGDNLTKLMPRIRRDMGIRDPITWHSWRHTFATRKIRGGGDLKKVSLLLGHSSTSTTERFYTHLTAEDLVDTAEI